MVKEGSVVHWGKKGGGAGQTPQLHIQRVQQHCLLAQLCACTRQGAGPTGSQQEDTTGFPWNLHTVTSRLYIMIPYDKLHDPVPTSSWLPHLSPSVKPMDLIAVTRSSFADTAFCQPTTMVKAQHNSPWAAWAHCQTASQANGATSKRSTDVYVAQLVHPMA